MQPQSALSIAAILPTFRRDIYLLQSIQSLLEQTRRPDEIIVIDQTPPEDQDTETRLALGKLEQSGLIQMVHLHPPAVSVARNLAACTAKSEILLYLDDDIIAAKSLVENHLRKFHDPEVHGVAGGCITPTDKTFYPVPPGFTHRNPVWQAFYHTRFDRPLQNICFMAGCNFSVRRESLIKAWGWDEHIINYGDRDLGIRLVQAGFRLDYDPEALLTHLAAPTGGTRVKDPKTPWKGYLRCVSIFYLAFRHLSNNPAMFIRFGLWRGARFSFLLRDNLLRPWRWPNELAAYFLALAKAYRWSRQGVKSPFRICTQVRTKQ